MQKRPHVLTLEQVVQLLLRDFARRSVSVKKHERALPASSFELCIVGEAECFRQTMLLRVERHGGGRLPFAENAIESNDIKPNVANPKVNVVWLLLWLQASLFMVHDSAVCRHVHNSSTSDSQTRSLIYHLSCSALCTSFASPLDVT